MAARTQELGAVAREIKPDVILLAHGAALSEPEDAQYLLEKCDVHGVQVGSSIERLAIEKPLEQRAAAFKTTHFPAGAQRWLR
jgi:predicted TIM-barrel enzyme